MCVIITIENGNFPDFKTLKDAESLNPHGGSIGWIENGKTNFHKGLKAKKINKIIQKQLKPKNIKTAIIHFRISSSGDIQNPKIQNNHPFVVNEQASNDISLKNIDYPLLFHNGTFDDIFDILIEVIKGKMVKIPSGDYTDSRIMAYLVHLKGVNFLKKVIKGWNKIAILDPKEGIIKIGSNWAKIGENECSNDYFIESNRYSKNHYSFFDSDMDFIKSTICYNQEDEKIYDELKTKHELSDYEIEDYSNIGYSLEQILELMNDGKYSSYEDFIDSSNYRVNYLND